MIMRALCKSCTWLSVLLLALSIAPGLSALEHPENPRHGFQDTSHWARVFESPERAKWQRPDEVVDALDLRLGQTVIDIGAGTGYFTRRFARAVGASGKAIGLDIEPGMVAYMNADAKKLKLSNYEARLVKPNDPELAPHSADVVFLCDVLHHIDDRVVYLKKLKPALKPGGRVVVVDFKEEAPIGPPAKMKIASDEMIAEFKDAGYRLVIDHAFLPYQYFLEFVVAPPG